MLAQVTATGIALLDQQHQAQLLKVLLGERAVLPVTH
jgi:hypothetical protein